MIKRSALVFAASAVWMAAAASAQSTNTFTRDFRFPPVGIASTETIQINVVNNAAALPLRAPGPLLLPTHPEPRSEPPPALLSPAARFFQPASRSRKPEHPVPAPKLSDPSS
jgi:hypothetical protein